MPFSPSQPLPCFSNSENDVYPLNCSHLAMMFGYLLLIIPPSHILIPEHHPSLPDESSLIQLTPSCSSLHLWLWLVQPSPCRWPCSYPPLFGLHSAARESFLHHKSGHAPCLRRGPHFSHGSGDPRATPTPPRPASAPSLLITPSCSTRIPGTRNFSAHGNLQSFPASVPLHKLWPCLKCIVRGNPAQMPLSLSRKTS